MSGIPTNQHMEINAFTLKYMGQTATLEKEFQENYFNKYIKQIRYALIFAAVMYGAFGMLDAALMPNMKNMLWFIRFGIVCPALLIGFLFSFTEPFKKAFSSLVAFFIVLGGAGIIAMITIIPTPMNYSYFAGLILVFMIGYCLRIGFMWTTLAGWVVVLLYNSITINHGNVPFALLVSNNFFIIAANIIGMYMSYTLERWARSDYYIKRVLEAEMEKRSYVEKQVEKNYYIQQTISSILKLSIESQTLEEHLKLTLEQVTELPWLKFERMGALFVVEERTQNMVMKSHQGFTSEQVAEKQRFAIDDHPCSNKSSGDINFISARSKKGHKQFAVPGHSYYCVPIKAADQLLGVMVIYVEPGHKRDPLEEDLLSAVSHTLAIIIQRKKLDVMKEQFMQTVSHELRTPLTSIIGYQDLLLSETLGPLQDIQKKQLKTALLNSEVLLSLINDLLDMSKLEAGEMPAYMTPVDIVSIVESVTDSFQPQAQKKDISLSFNPDQSSISIISDEMKLQRIIRNLVGNAIKFTDNGDITVSMNWKNSNLNISIQDSGMGIPENSLQRIFEKFQQVDNSASRKFDGTGLGLPITKKMTELLGGTISVKSEVGKGSKFTVTLPSQLW